MSEEENETTEITPEEELRVAQESKHNFLKLKELQGWKDLVRLVNEQAMIRQNMITTNPITSFDMCFEKATLTGERLGMLLVIRLVDSCLESLEERIDVLNEELNNEPESDSGSDGDSPVTDAP